MTQGNLSMQTPHTARLDRSVIDRLHRVCMRFRLYVATEGVAWVVGFLFLACTFQLLVDYGTRGLQWSMRAALLAVIIAVAAWLAWRRLIAPLRMRMGPAEAAHLVERRYPNLASRLISAVRFAAGEVGPPEANSPSLVASVISHAGDAAKDTDFSTVLDSQRARRAAMTVTSVLAIFILAVILWPTGMTLWFARNVLLQEVDWPKRTELIVELQDGVLIGARGDDLIVQAWAEGAQPREVEIFFETASGQVGRETMVTVGSPGSYRYRYTFKNAQEDFTFHLRGGDDRTDECEARLLERPRVVESEMRIEPPDYARLEPFMLGDGQRSAEILPGTRVTIWIRTNKPVTQAVLMAGNDRIIDADADGDRYVAHVAPEKTHTYHFSLVDEVGLENRKPVRFSIRVTVDEPPRARMRLPGVGDMITEEAILPFELDFADTYGLATAELYYLSSREGAAEESIPLPDFKPGMTTFTTTLPWPVAEALLHPGERITILARATDFDTVSGPNFAQTPDLTLRVVTRDELIAELRRREQELRMDFERLVDQQEELRGRLLTVFSRSGEFSSPAELAEALTPLERRQRTIAGSVTAIRQRFEQVLAEMRVNQLDTHEEEVRLGEMIIEPMTDLARRDLVTAADAIRQWSRDGSPEKASKVDPQQAEILSQMRAILATMIQWEGYHEVVNMLGDIIRLQNELNEETKKQLLDEARGVFDD
jgi:hypothetical protein